MGKTTKMAGGSQQREQDVIRRLRALDQALPEAIVMQIGKKTRYGTRPHAHHGWGYTKELLEKRNEVDAFEEVIALFRERLGIEDEIAAAKWLTLNLNE